MSHKIPTNKIQLFVFKIINHWSFEAFIMFCIVSNVLIMALSYEGSSVEYQMVLENINLAFTSIFIMETILKIISYGLSGKCKIFIYIKGFWLNGWNRFDFFVVLSSIVDLSLNAMGGTSTSFLRVGPQIIRIIRVLRLIILA